MLVHLALISITCNSYHHPVLRFLSEPVLNSRKEKEKRSMFRNTYICTQGKIRKVEKIDFQSRYMLHVKSSSRWFLVYKEVKK